MAISKKVFHQMLACSSIILNQFMIGIGFGWIGPTLPKMNLQSYDSPIKNISADQASWIASLHETGRILGPLISPLIIDNFGRKYTVVVVAVMCFAFNITVMFAHDICMLYIARVIFGFANGVHDVVSTIYIAENCSPSFRGIFSSFVILTFHGALLVEYILATYGSYTNTAIVNTILSCGVFITLYFCTETPYFLVMKGKYKKALKNLLWLRDGNSPVAVVEELNEIELNVREEMQKDKYTERFNSSANLKAICIVVGINVLGSATGGGAFLAYPTLVFSSTDTFIKAEHFAMIFCLVLLVMVFASSFTVEEVDRRILMVGSFSGMTCSTVCSFVFFYLHANKYEIKFYPWLVFASIAMYGSFSSILSTVSHTLKGEILPLSVRAVGSSVGVISQSMASFCVLKIFLPVHEKYGMEMNFLGYSLAGVLACVFVYSFLPETRGKSLYEIQNSFNKSETILDDSVEESEKILEREKNEIYDKLISS